MTTHVNRLSRSSFSRCSLALLTVKEVIGEEEEEEEAEKVDVTLEEKPAALEVVEEEKEPHEQWTTRRIFSDPRLWLKLVNLCICLRLWGS